MPSMTWRVITTPSVAWYLVGSSLSNLGTWIYNLASAVLMYRLTGSTFLVGTVVFAQFVGTLFLAPWAGAAADRFDRRRLLILLQTLAAIPTGLLAIAEEKGLTNPSLVLVATLFVGLAAALSSPARQAIVPLLVDAKDVDAVIAFHAVTFQLARAAGPLIGAAVIALWGMPLAIGINSVSFLAFVAALSRIRPQPQVKATNLRGSFRRTLGAAWADPLTRTLLLAIVAMSIGSDPPATLAPKYVSLLGYSDTAAGLLMGAFGVGSMVVGALLAPRLGKWRHGFVGSMAAQVVGILMFALAPDLSICLLGLAVAGGGFVGALTQATAHIQRLAPAGAMGRYMAIWGVAFLGSRPIAALIDGATAELFGVRVAALVVIVPLAGVLLFGPWRRTLQDSRSLATSRPNG